MKSKALCQKKRCLKPNRNGKLCWKHYNEYYIQTYGVDRKKKYRTSEKNRERGKEYRIKAKKEVLGHYSNDKFECNCCGETIYEFLTLDHVFNNGALHRKQINKTSAYVWCRKNNYPSGFQVLCMNCNFAKQINGECPHMKQKNKLQILKKEGI